MSLEDDVKAIVVEQLGVSPEDVNETSSFIEDLNADSLDLTELIMTLEEKFAFEISGHRFFYLDEDVNADWFLNLRKDV